ncbi:MAG TPA: cyclic nucleotide-binding domain-containing protein [Kofleriaceae bacterium]|nr:cyclic nucleotide-binding domain-containing protein [Kofleriaceae bacterium]
MSITAEDLGSATARLRAQPADFGAWLEVAAVLAALGAADDAEEAFAVIGEGARVHGRVALAVACARHLAERGSVRGPELVDAIVDTYATGGPHFAFTQPPAPDEPPAIGEPPAGEAVARARWTIDQLAPWLVGRQLSSVMPAPLLSALSKPGARALIGVMTARAYATAQTIVEVGEPASALYWLAHGSVAISRPKPEPRAPGSSGPVAQLGELHSGAFFGEIALVGGTTRTANVMATEDCWVLEIPAKAVETAAQKQPKLAEVLAFHARARLLANVTRTSPLFKPLKEADRDELLAKFTSEIVPAGTTFIREGEANDSLWVIVAGWCEVKSGGGAMADVGPGAVVGELSILRGDAASADVTALEPAILLRLAKQDFDAIAKRHPELRTEIGKLLKLREQANRAMFQDATDLIV